MTLQEQLNAVNRKLDRIAASEKRLYHRLYAVQVRRHRKHGHWESKMTHLQKWAERLQKPAGKMRRLGWMLGAHEKGKKIPYLNSAQYSKLTYLLKKKNV